GDDLVEVPDKDRGDAGIEAYTVSGNAYQCYSPEEPLTVSQRYEKQRTKMTTDIGKFIGNGAKLSAILGVVKVRRWILLVPVVDSREIVVHSVEQTERVRASGISYADRDIFVMAQCFDRY